MPEFDIRPEEMLVRADETLAVKRAEHIMAMYPSKKYGSRVKESEEQLTSEARDLFSIPEDEDVYDSLTRIWEKGLHDHYLHPDASPSLSIPFTVLPHLDKDPYRSVIEALRESFAAQNLFFGYYPIPDETTVRLIFFLESIGKQHPLSSCSWKSGKIEDALSTSSTRTEIESLESVPSSQALEYCSDAVAYVSKSAGSNFLTPARGRYASESHTIFFTWSFSGRTLLLLIDTDSGQLHLYGYGESTEEMLCIDVNKSEAIHTAFEWLLRFKNEKRE